MEINKDTKYSTTIGFTIFFIALLLGIVGTAYAVDKRILIVEKDQETIQNSFNEIKSDVKWIRNNMVTK